LSVVKIKKWGIAGVVLSFAISIAYLFQFDSNTSNDQQYNEKLILDGGMKSQSGQIRDQKQVLLPRVDNLNEMVNLFIVDKPPVKEARREKPVPPPLPYIYMGKMNDKNGLVVFLTRNEKLYVIRSPEQIDPDYRIDVINPPLMELTYLPLNEKQILNIGVNSR
jgi:hypothetical protein